MFKARHKYNAKPTTVDNLRFDSKLEARYYGWLKMQQGSGQVVGFLRQVPLHFESGIIYRLDFLVFNSDGTCEAIDCKGIETKEFLLKKKLIDTEYPWLLLKIIKNV